MIANGVRRAGTRGWARIVRGQAVGAWDGNAKPSTELPQSSAPSPQSLLRRLGMKQNKTCNSEVPQPPAPSPQSLLRITEQDNPASVALDVKPTTEILRIINREDQGVAPAVAKTIPKIARAVDMAVRAIRQGGRMIYLGAGTSGRLGVLDAAECLPTFGSDRVLAVIAGGGGAMFKSKEEMEDNPLEAERDLRRVNLSGKDVLVGISASGHAPYVLGGMRYARRRGAKTVGLTANPAAPMKSLAERLHRSCGRTGGYYRLQQNEGWDGPKTRAQYAFHSHHGALGASLLPLDDQYAVNQSEVARARPTNLDQRHGRQPYPRRPNVEGGRGKFAGGTPDASPRNQTRRSPATSDERKEYCFNSSGFERRARSSPGRSHSRESGNPPYQAWEMSCLRTGFPLSRE